jgi:hypothetical protein
MYIFIDMCTNHVWRINVKFNMLSWIVACLGLVFASIRSCWLCPRVVIPQRRRHTELLLPTQPRVSHPRSIDWIVRRGSAIYVLLAAPAEGDDLVRIRKHDPSRGFILEYYIHGFLHGSSFRCLTSCASFERSTGERLTSLAKTRKQMG